MSNEQAAASLYALAATGAGTYYSEDQLNESGRGVVVVVDLTTVVATGTCTVTIQGKDRVSGKYYDLLASTALATAATTTLTVYPGLTAVGNSVASNVVPRQWRVKVVVANAAITGTIGASTIV